MKNKYTQYFIYLMSAGCLAILLFLVVNLSDTIDELAINLITQKKEETKNQLDNFFNPVVKDINITTARGETGFFDSISLQEFNLYFIPFLQNSRPISSLMLSDYNGNEKMLLQMDSSWVNRNTFDGSELKKADKYEWSFQKGKLDTLKHWKEEKSYDPRTRPWFQEAIDGDETINWTSPYVFFTTKEPGITASKKWINSKSEVCVFGFDLLLLDISKFTSRMEVSENGKAFIFMEDNRVLGLPKDNKFENIDSLKNEVLKPLSEIGIPVLTQSKKVWIESGKSEDCFSFEYEGEKWRGSISEYILGKNTLHIGVIAPESDFLAAIQQTRIMIFGGFALVVIFTLIIARVYYQIRKTNLLLRTQKKETETQRDYANEQHQLAEEQKLMLEEKNNEIFDSINYAERIQRSFLATKETLDEHLRDYFVFFKPKEAVSGDFYWAAELNNNNFAFTVADSTGHGVPGAIMSLLNITSLEKSVETETEPHLILNKTREIIVNRLSKDGSEHGGKDGMDCNLMVLNQDKSVLTFASANNTIVIIRQGEILEYKGDKMPVGKHDRDTESFTLHSVQLQKGDVIYALTDGFPDQFGGPKGKKYMIKNLKNKFLQIADMPMIKQEEFLSEEFSNWMQDNEQIDDVCIIGVRV